MRFKEFHEVDICKPEAILAIASFFCPKRRRLVPTFKWYFIIRRDTYDSNYSYWIGSVIWMLRLNGLECVGFHVIGGFLFV